MLESNLRKTNLNNHVYIKINEKGWEHLRKTDGLKYIVHCIDRVGYRFMIEGEIWHRLQIHEVFGLFSDLNQGYFELDIMFDNDELKTVNNDT